MVKKDQGSESEPKATLLKRVPPNLFFERRLLKRNRPERLNLSFVRRLLKKDYDRRNTENNQNIFLTRLMDSMEQSND